MVVWNFCTLRNFKGINKTSQKLPSASQTKQSLDRNSFYPCICKLIHFIIFIRRMKKLCSYRNCVSPCLLTQSVPDLYSNPYLSFKYFVIVQSPVTSNSAIPWAAACQASLSFTISQSLLKLMSIELVMPSNHLVLCHPLLLLSFPASGSFPVSWLLESGGQSIGVSASISVLQWIFMIQFLFRLTGLILLCTRDSEETPPTASVLRHSAFFMVQLSHSYMTTGNTRALTIWTFVGKVISLLFNIMSRFVIAFLPRSKYLLMSWLKSPSRVILEPKI